MPLQGRELPLQGREMPWQGLLLGPLLSFSPTEDNYHLRLAHHATLPAAHVAKWLVPFSSGGAKEGFATDQGQIRHTFPDGGHS